MEIAPGYGNYQKVKQNSGKDHGEKILLETEPTLTMPSPLGEGQTDAPINRHNRGEVRPSPTAPFLFCRCVLRYRHWTLRLSHGG